MKNFRRIICGTFAALLLIGCFASGGFAAPAKRPTATLGTGSGCIGDTVEITVSLENNPGFTAFIVGIDYDHTQLTLLKDKAASAPGVPSSPTCSEVGFGWLSSRDYYGDGPFVILQFLINEGASEGVSVPVKFVFTPGNICNYNEKDVDFDFVDGSIEIIPHVHSYESAVTDPTCEEGGYTTYTCTICGCSYVDDPVDALGHTWDAGSVTKRPTETEAGVRLFTCAVCGETKEEEIPPLDYLRGDINGDGSVDTKDLTRYQKYLADDSATVVEKALDVNGDGVPGIDDLIRLLKYLAGYGVELF